MLTHRPTQPLLSRYRHFFICTTLRCSRVTPGATSTAWLRSSLSPTSQTKPMEAAAALISTAHCVGRNRNLVKQQESQRSNDALTSTPSHYHRRAATADQLASSCRSPLHWFKSVWPIPAGSPASSSISSLEEKRSSIWYSKPSRSMFDKYEVALVACTFQHHIQHAKRQSSRASLKYTLLLHR